MSRSADVTLPAEAVRARIEEVLREFGVAAAAARLTADHLIEGSLRGYHHHGADRISQLVEGLRGGTLSPSAPVRTVREGPAYAVLDAGGGLGPPALHDAVALAVRYARLCGLGLAAVLNAGHVGTLAPYAEAIARQNMLGVVLSTTEPAVVVPGGATRLLGTNPLAYAFPGHDAPISADFSTSAVSRSELLNRLDAGTPLDPGSGVDRNGRPTAVPAEALDGGLLPFGGGVKGTLVSLLVSIIAGPLVSGLANHEVRGTRWMAAAPSKTDAVLAFDIAQLADTIGFATATGDLLDRMASSSPDFHRPGSASRRCREVSERDGIPVSAAAAALLFPPGSRRGRQQR